MSFSVPHLLALVAAPAAVLLAHRRLAAGSRLSLVLTIAVTWLIATILVYVVLHDQSDISFIIVFYFLMMPWIGALIAAVAATRTIRTRGQFAPAFILSLVGWVAGLVLGWLVDTDGAAGLLSHFWDYGAVVALPACYAASGAVLAAGLGDRTA